MITRTVNPYAVKPGNKIATGPNKSRTVKRVTVCGTSPESVHLDHECYDSRFTTVQLVTSE